MAFGVILGVAALRARVAYLEAAQESAFGEYCAERFNHRVPTVQPPSLVYFARMVHVAATHPRHGLIKIGRTTRLEQRMADLGTEVLATVAGGSELETRLHRRFADHRVEGEWFREVPEILAEIQRAVAA